MHVAVTGAAGFIGSHLAGRLLDQGHSVIGIDSLAETYDPRVKRRRAEALSKHADFTLVLDDLATYDLRWLLKGVGVVFHLAALPGVRPSWEQFSRYAHENLVVLHRLLEFIKNHDGPRMVFASSSSVYGRSAPFPTPEEAPRLPSSPYGITKSAGEDLCRTYVDDFDVHATMLRYFTVYGPEQRPDMAAHRIIDAALEQRPFRVFGSGEQKRDMTYVGDVVSATIAAGIEAADAVVPGDQFNVAGGHLVSLNELIATVSRIVGQDVPVTYERSAAGDVEHTEADSRRIRSVVGWKPVTSLEEGLSRQVAWQRERL